MTQARALHRPRPPRVGLRWVAAATALAFGCVTAHPPGRAPLVGPPPAKVRIAEPEIYLSVEGTSSIQPEEWNEAGARTRAALAAALDSRFPSADGEADAVLMVREHAVARTGGRKVSQVFAVVAVVAVIVIVVVAMVSSKGSSKSSSAKSGAKPAPAPSSRPPSPSARRAAATPPSAARPPAVSPAPPPVASHPVSPAPPTGAAGRPAARALPAPGAAPVGPVAGGGVELDVGVALAVPVGEPPPPYPMPPPPPFDPEERGFFAGDEVVLELELRDARTDQVIWASALKRGADPKDPAAVAALLDEVLAGEAWAGKSNQTR